MARATSLVLLVEIQPNALAPFRSDSRTVRYGSMQALYYRSMRLRRTRAGIRHNLESSGPPKSKKHDLAIDFPATRASTEASDIE